MKQTHLRRVRILPILIIATCFATCRIATSAADPLPRLKGDGARIVEADSGKQVILKGCNLGNWLLLESWMQKWDMPDQQAILRTLAERFGEEKSHALMETYRSGWITPRDFQQIKSFDFNLVRIPFESLLLMDEQGKMRPDAFKWLDKALSMAEDVKVYVILDMHGAPGRQSTDGCTGEGGQNRLWTDAAAQKRMIELWTRIASRYKNRTVVAGYDLLNEPYADFKSDVTANLRDITARCYKAIRATGDQHLIIFPNALGRGVTFYGDIRSAGMTQVGFTDHYYAGLFGSPSTIASHANVLGRTVPETAAYCERVGGPMLIGEFNVVLEQCGGDAMMRRYYDEFARRGWMATMWSYKLLKPAAGVEPNNWYMVTNADPMPVIDVRKSSYDEIDHYFQSLATMKLAMDEPLRAALTATQAPPIPLPVLDALPDSAPSARSTRDGWTLRDIDTAKPAGVSEDAGGNLSMVASGGDIFGSRDSFSFLSKPAPTSTALVATISEFANSDVYAKAGLMIRFGDPVSPNYVAAPFALIHAFPEGGMSFTVRERAGVGATEVKRIGGPWPLRLALTREGAHVEAFAGSGADGWVKIGSADISDAAGPAQAGVALCSHRAELFTSVAVRDLSMLPTSKLSGTIEQHLQPSAPQGKNLLVNGSFESNNVASSAPTQWNQWGSDLRVETAESYAHAGKSGLSYTGGNDGVWQDVGVEPGKQYALNLFVHRADVEAVAAGKQSLSIALEATVDGKQVALAERTCDVAQLESGGGWSLVSISARAISERARVVIRFNPAPGGTHQTGLAVDDISLIESRD